MSHGRPHGAKVSGRLLGVVLSLAIVALGPTNGRSQPAGEGSYSPLENGWNGISYLLETAREAAVELDITPRIDWEEIGPDAVLLLLYPLTPPDLENLRAFLRDGGSVILADDFGRGDELLRALGLERRPAPPEHTRFFDGQRGFPEFLLDAPANHFLYFNTARVVANHPTSVSGTDLDVIVPYEGTRTAALVGELVVGHGSLLVVADASMFINDMLRGLHGDKQFIANVLRYFCRADTCAVTLLSPAGGWTGEYRPRSFVPDDVAGFFRMAVGVVDRAVAGLSRWLASAAHGHLLFGVATLALLLLSALLVRRGPELRTPVLTRGPAPGAAAHRALALSARKRADFSHPLRLLAARVSRALEAESRAERRLRLSALLRRLGDAPAAPTARGGRLVTVSARELSILYREARNLEVDAAPAPSGGQKTRTTHEPK